MKSFRAILLAAGLGTRLRPITNKIPKCLVKVGDKPLLGRWIYYLNSIGCESLLINTHYLSDQVENYINQISDVKMKVTLTYEEKLLGTAGTLIENKNFFGNNTGILIHADNYSEAKLDQFIEAHHKRDKNCILTMLTFDTNKPESSGIIAKDDRNIMTGFYEKIKNPPGKCANCAIYAFENRFLSWLQKNYPNARDFSIDVLPNLLNQVQTFHNKELFVDIGDIKSLDEVNALISRRGSSK